MTASTGAFGKGGLSQADFAGRPDLDDTVGLVCSWEDLRRFRGMRDARSMPRPLRRTADVYDMFLGTDRIRADSTNRWLAEHHQWASPLADCEGAGIKNLPGEVS